MSFTSSHNWVYEYGCGAECSKFRDEVEDVAIEGGGLALRKRGAVI